MAVDPTLEQIPTPDCDFEAINRFAETYDAYERIGGGPEHLLAMYDPIRTEWTRSGDFPDWMGIDLLRGLLFLMYREARFDGTYAYLSGAEYDRFLMPFRQVIEAIRRSIAGKSGRGPATA